jgi:hypothetical protein
VHACVRERNCRQKRELCVEGTGPEFRTALCALSSHAFCIQPGTPAAARNYKPCMTASTNSHTQIPTQADDRCSSVHSGRSSVADGMAAGGTPTGQLQSQRTMTSHLKFVGVGGKSAGAASFARPYTNGPRAQKWLSSFSNTEARTFWRAAAAPSKETTAGQALAQVWLPLERQRPSGSRQSPSKNATRRSFSPPTSKAHHGDG